MKTLIAVLILTVCLPLTAMAQVTIDFDGKTIGTITKGSIKITTGASPAPAPAPTPTPTPIPAPTPIWTRIASEGQSFTVSGTKAVRYGAGLNWVEKVVTGSGQCTNAWFGKDPARGVIKTCEVSNQGPSPTLAPAPTPTPTPPPPPPPDPSIPSITGMVGVHWGVQGFVSSLTETKKYYINLPDGLPALAATSTTEARELIPKGTPYSIDMAVVDAVGQMHGSQFDLTVTDPNGRVVKGSFMEAMTMVSFYKRAPPGRYLITIKATQFALGEKSAIFTLGFSTTPWLIKGELK